MNFGVPKLKRSYILHFKIMYIWNLDLQGPQRILLLIHRQIVESLVIISSIVASKMDFVEHKYGVISNDKNKLIWCQSLNVR